MRNLELVREAQQINYVLEELRIDARIPLDENGLVAGYSIIARSGLVSHKLLKSPSQTAKRVIDRVSDISEVVTSFRGVKTQARISELPLAIELPHPNPETLFLHDLITPYGSDAVTPSGKPDFAERLKLPPFTMLAGKSYSHTLGEKYELINFSETPHFLAAAMTKNGKSIFMRNVISTLTLNTSPAELGIVLVDMKNVDMVLFKDLPHVISYAWDIDDVTKSISSVRLELDRRIRESDKNSFTLVLLADELADLANMPEAQEDIERIASKGASMGVHIVGSTQHAVEKGGISTMLGANFSERFIGRVAGATAAAIVSNRKGTNAHLLPPRSGAFLRIDDDVTRIQTAMVTDRFATHLNGVICGKWAGVPSVRLSVRSQPEITQHRRPEVAPVVAPEPVAVAPIIQPPSEAEQHAEMIRDLYESDASLAKMIRRLFGEDANTGGSNRTKTIAAVTLLQNATTTATTKQNGPILGSEGQNEHDSGSSSDSSSSDNVINFKERKAAISG